MRFAPNEFVAGFRVRAIRESAELRARVVEMAHEKTGARLLWLDNGAENKVFSIAFRTLPEDDTGVFHILEHSVLCGSERYPVREPFVELLKGSMNTFLNAMTFPDMTMYPVGSRNNRDLLNLTGVYLDAVFRPRILSTPLIFCQEGWHIEMDEQGRPLFKGVVLNEMKGSMSDVESLAERCMNRQLFPDTGYGFNSGGDPEAIPTLSLEAFRETYRRHYHPSNAWIYLDGAVPMEEMLPLIDSYLSPYEPLTDLPRFVYQTPKGSDAALPYELGQEEDPANRGHLLLSRITGSWKDKTENMAVSIIADVLTGTNDAPLKRLVLEKGLAQDISLSMDDTTLQSFITFHAENVTDGKEEELLALIRSYGDTLSARGLDLEAAEASLNRFAFGLKEEDEPQGIDRAIRAMGSWLYEGDPLFALENDAQLSELRAMLRDGRLQALAVSLFRPAEGDCVLRMRPSKTLGAEKRAEEEARLRAITSAWTASDRAENEALLSALQAWQTEPDTPEALAALPMLKKEDADIPPFWTKTEMLEEAGVRLLFHPLPTSGVLHLKAYLSLSDLSLREIQHASLLCALLGKLPTASHDALSLQREIKKLTGRLSFATIVRPHPEDPSLCTPLLVASLSVLKENVPAAQALLAEILKTTDFSDTGRILEIVNQLEMASRQRIVGGGHAIGVRNVMSHFSADMALRNAMEGDEAVRYLHHLAGNPETDLPALLDTARRVLDQTVCRKRMILSLTAEERLSFEAFVSSLPEGTEVPRFASYRLDSPFRRGFRIPAQVGFTARGFRLEKKDQPAHGRMLLAANILTYSFLWNRVRVQGGAYGCGFQADRYGNLFSYSYRDPAPDKTLSVDRDAAAFLKQFLREGESMDKYIISTLNDLNPLISPREQGALADLRWLSGYTREQAERVRKEILHADEKDLLAVCGLLEAFAERGAVCVVAPGAALDRCPDLAVEDL